MDFASTTQVYLSNQIEWLLQPLRQQFLSGTPLCQRLIIVPSPAMKSWLTFKMAQEDGIAMGFETTYLDQGIHMLYQSLHQESCHLHEKFPTSCELTLALEWEIRNLLQNPPLQNEAFQQMWKPLFNYLKISSSTSSQLSKKSEKRLISLVERLAKLFLEYGIAGGEAIKPWVEQGTCWQSFLWQQVVGAGNKYRWTYPYKALTETIFPPHFERLQVHLFAMSYLPPLYHTFLREVSKILPVSFYLLSPCEAFWSDICSDKESQRLQMYWEKRKVSENQQLALEEFLRDRNPLLANFGRIGREMAQAVEEAHSHVEAHYVLSANAANFSCYEEHLHPDFILRPSQQTSLTLLEAVQTDITLLRNPENTPPVELNAKDLSIQVHNAASIKREVQILHDRLLHVMHLHAKTNSPIFQKDWIVMAPDIRLYAPFIKMIFGAPDSPLDFQIMDAELPQQNLYIQAFAALLKLSSSRWDTVSVLMLLDTPAFRKKFAFTAEDMDHIRSWVKETGVRWGMDGSHRQKILQQNHCHNLTEAVNLTGTWENSFQRLLKGLAVEESDEPLVEVAQAALVGKWILAIRSLYAHLQPLSDGSMRSLSAWNTYLKMIASTYLASEKSEDEELLETHLLHFQRLASQMETCTFPFQSIHALLEASFQRESVSYKETRLHAIRFCSMLPMRAIPSRGIALLGMQEGSFPRYYPDSSLHVFTHDPLADYAPSQVDFDRYLFLETLISARDYFLMSYQGYSPDGKEQPPSLLVQELLAYVDKNYRLGQQLPSTLCHFKHPFHAYDRNCFTAKSPYASFSKTHFQLAQAREKEKLPHHAFISSFQPTVPPAASVENECTIDLKHLISLARNPLENYFNRQLGMYLEDEEKRKIPHEDFFSMTQLAKGLIKKDALKYPLEGLFLKAEKKGDFPAGYFKEIMSEQLIEEIDRLKIPLKRCGVALESIFQIEFSNSTMVPTQINPICWSVPPLKIIDQKGNVIKLIGTLSDITPQGLLAYIKDEKKEVIKAWPGYLMLNCIAKLYPSLFGTHLIFGKSGTMKPPFFNDPFEELKKYLEYYFLCQNNASPLLPEWIPDFIENPKGCKTKIQKSLMGPYALRNEYMQWMIRGEIHMDYDQMLENWHSLAKTFFSEIFVHWYPSRNKGDTHV
ncbi:MAG: exodeoxyribonuclease V subunit gamma [Parachlamydia sp.]|nr:MAG: exodeoxyribonuclease V subunit gamma [Parachlamydia sp.]